MRASTTIQLSDPMPFADAMWSAVPNEPGVYVIADEKKLSTWEWQGVTARGVLETDFAITHLARSSTCSRSTFSSLEFSSLGWSELRIHEMRRPRAVNA